MARARTSKMGTAKTRQKPLERCELARRLRAALPELREAYGVRNLGLFGSCVRGEARKSSDIDLLVGFDQTPGLLKFVELEQYLSDLLGVKVDLVMEGALKPRIGERILSEVIPV